MPATTTEAPGLCFHAAHCGATTTAPCMSRRGLATARAQAAAAQLAATPTLF